MTKKKQKREDDLSPGEEGEDRQSLKDVTRWQDTKKNSSLFTADSNVSFSDGGKTFRHFFLLQNTLDWGFWREIAEKSTAGVGGKTRVTVGKNRDSWNERLRNVVYFSR